MNGSRSTPARRRLRLAALIVAVIGVLALAAAAFVLSYPGARDTALTAGVTKELARIYPGIFDAVLVIACAGALALRGVLRAYAWLAILVVTAAIAAADATHAMAVALPKRPMEATVAVVPWAVLLIGFTLLYAMARQARPARTPAPMPAPLSAPPAQGNGVLTAGKTVPLNELLKAKPGQDPAPATPPAETAPAKKARGRKARGKTTPTGTTDTTTEAADTTPAQTAPTETAPPEPVRAETTAASDTETSRPQTADTAPPETALAEPALAELTSPHTRTTGTTEMASAETPPTAPPTTAPADTTQAEVPLAAPLATAPAELPQADSAGSLPAGTTESLPARATGNVPAKASESVPTESTPSGPPLTALPPLPRRRAIPRDEPSDADAESPEPAIHFNRLRSSPTPPDDED